MLKTLSILWLAMLCVALGQVFFKKGVGANWRAGFKNPLVWLGILFMTGHFFLWMLALSLAEISWAMPMRAVQYILVALLALIFLGEKISWPRWVGIGWITAGILLMMQTYA